MRVRVVEPYPMWTALGAHGTSTAGSRNALRANESSNTGWTGSHTPRVILLCQVPRLVSAGKTPAIHQVRLRDGQRLRVWRIARSASRVGRAELWLAPRRLQPTGKGCLPDLVYLLSTLSTNRTASHEPAQVVPHFFVCY